MISIDRIRIEQIKSIYRNTPPGMTATPVAHDCHVGTLAKLRPSG